RADHVGRGARQLDLLGPARRALPGRERERRALAVVEAPAVDRAPREALELGHQLVELDAEHLLDARLERRAARLTVEGLVQIEVAVKAIAVDEEAREAARGLVAIARDLVHLEE